LVHGTCQENILIQPELQRITLDGQRKATIKAADASRPAIQVLGREVTIKGFTVTGGSFGIGINRGATAVVDTNTIEHAANTGLEVSQNSLRASSITLFSTTDVIQNNGADGIHVADCHGARDKSPMPMWPPRLWEISFTKRDNCS
jgi:hypothetical protein